MLTPRQSRWSVNSRRWVGADKPVFCVLFPHCSLSEACGVCCFLSVCSPQAAPRGVGTHVCLHHVHGMLVRVCTVWGACVHVCACVHVFCCAGTSLPRPCVGASRLAFSAWCLPSGVDSPGLRPSPCASSTLALWVASPCGLGDRLAMCPGGLGPVGRACPEKLRAPSSVGPACVP